MPPGTTPEARFPFNLVPVWAQCQFPDAAWMNKFMPSAQLSAYRRLKRRQCTRTGSRCAGCRWSSRWMEASGPACAVACRPGPLNPAKRGGRRPTFHERQRRAPDPILAPAPVSTGCQVPRREFGDHRLFQVISGSHAWRNHEGPAAIPRRRPRPVLVQGFRLTGRLNNCLAFKCGRLSKDLPASACARVTAPGCCAAPFTSPAK